MTNAESSKKAKKRKLKETLAIVAALRNTSNAGIRISNSNDGSLPQSASQANKTHLSKKKLCTSEKFNSKKKKNSVNMDSRDTNDVYSTDGDFSAEEDAYDFSEDDEIVPNSYSHGSRENPSSNESHKSQKTGGSTKSKVPLIEEDIEENSEENSSDGDDSIESDDAIDTDAELENSNPSSLKSHRGRKFKVMATDSGSKLKVTFNANGQPVGENSEHFSSYLGNIASEMVPLTFTDWRAIKIGYKDLYWQSILQKFILDESRKTYALQQIGRLWRAHKSRLRGKIRVYRKNKKDITCLKPEDCDDAEWEMFVKQMSRRNFIMKSHKFQELREKQNLPHTCSRKGYARLDYQMQKESLNPSSITRVDVWCKGHTKKSGKPSNSTVAERMKKIKEIRHSATSDSSNNSIQNDALSQVLGPDRYGRVRGKGAGVTPSKVGVRVQNQELVTQLQEKVLTVERGMVQMTNLVNTQNELIRNLIASLNIQKGESQQVVTEQLIQSTIAPTTSQGQGMSIGDQGIQTTLPQGGDIGSNDDQGVRTTTTSLPQGQGIGSRGRQCNLMNWTAPHDLVAKGHWETNDPVKLVHGVPLGDNASKVWVDEVVKSEPRLWRENSELQTMGDAKGTAIAWPTKHVIFTDHHGK